MKNIIIIFLFLAILGFAAIGCLYIFDVKSAEDSLDLLLKIEGTIVLLGGCSALISVLLAGANKGSQD